MRTQNCLATVGRNIKTLIFDPMYSFHNMYEFVVMLSYYLERNKKEKTGKVIYHKGNIIPVFFNCFLIEDVDCNIMHVNTKNAAW
jgi:hypothetical protein